MITPKYYLTTYKRREKTNSLLFKDNNRLRITLLKNKDNFLKKFSLYNPDEEYVTKLKYFNMNVTQNPKKENNRPSLYNLNVIQKFPSLIKKDKDNAESFNEKKRLLTQLTLKKNIFDKNSDIDHNNQTYANRYENIFKENKKEKERKEIEKKIQKLKILLSSLSEELSATINEIESLKIDVDIVRNFRTHTLLNNNIKKYNESINNNANNNEKEKETNKTENNDEELKKTELSKEREKEDNKFRLDVILLAKSKLANEIKKEKNEKIAILDEKRLSLLNKINICEKELKKFRTLHTNVKNELLLHYHILLSEGKDTRKEGLVWIIQAIWNLKSNVMLSYLPKFLDEKLITFIFKYASKINTIKKLEKNLKELTLKLKIKKEELRIKMTNKKNKKESYIENNNNQNNDEKNSNDESNDVNNESNTENEDSNKENKKFNHYNQKAKTVKAVKFKKFELRNINNSIDDNNSKCSIPEEKFEIRKIFKNENNIDKINLTDKNINNLTFKDFYDSNKFQETFKTSLYNNTNNELNENYYSNYLQEENSKNVFLNFDKSNIKNSKKSYCKMTTNFMKSIFNKKLMSKNGQLMKSEEKKIKFKDYEYIYNTKMDDIDQSTMEIFNEYKKTEKLCIKLKNETEKMLRDELNRVSKSFYLNDYGGKFDIDQKTVISAIIGEDSVRKELMKEKKEEKEYFKTLKELRDGKSVVK